MKSLVVVAVLCLAGCGGGSISPTLPPQPTSAVTSVTVSPSTASVVASNQQQFAVTVAGTGNFSSAVTWGVTGLGSIDQTGLFTASSTAGPVTVTATSQEDSTKSSSATVTVTVAPVSMQGWYGTLVPSDGSKPLPLDFDLTQTGSTLTSGPVLIIAKTSADIQFCTNFDLFIVQGSNGSILKPQPNNPLPNMTGTISNQNVTLSYAPYSFGTRPTITMTGTMGLDAAGYRQITGAYSTPLTPCLSGNFGTFTFNEYQSFSGTYVGPMTYGTVGSGNPPITANNVTITVSSMGTYLGGTGSFSYSAIPPPFNYPTSPVFQMFSETAGRFFHGWDPDGGQNSSNLIFWGLVAGPDNQGNQINTYIGTGFYGTPQLFDPMTPISGTLTRQ